MRASLLTIGDELLIGQVVDTNASWIGKYLFEHGVRLIRKQTVGDSHAEIAQGLSSAAEGVDVVLMTGGLGPTADDITLEALARHTGKKLVFNSETFDRIKQIFEQVLKRPVDETHRRQAMQPEDAQTFENTEGTAPGIWLEKDDIVYIAMPGVPREMKYLMQNEVVPALQRKFVSAARANITIHTAGWGETQIAAKLKQALKSFHESVGIAYLPALGSVRLRLTVEGQNESINKAHLDEAYNSVVKALPPEIIFGLGDTSLVKTIQHMLKQRGETVATAESCTGGRLAHILTNEPGASQIFHAGMIAYDNRLKIEELFVKPQTLQDFGAVSKETVTQMAVAVREKFKSTYGISTSGIAGPTGGTPEKPVGTVWIAIASASKVNTHVLSLSRNRATNIAYSANAALNFLRLFMLAEKD